MRGRGWFGWGGGWGRGLGWGGGMGFGFRGSSPPWPYVGLGRGGLPRCWYPGLYTAPHWPAMQASYPFYGAATLNQRLNPRIVS